MSSLWMNKRFAERPTFLFSSIYFSPIQRSIYKLGITQYALEKYDMALSALKNALDRSTVIVGSAHFIVAEILNNLGCVHYRMGDLKGSAELFQKSFLIQKNLLRDELYCDYDDEQENERNLFLVNIATTGSNIGLIKIILGELEESVGLLESALLVSQFHEKAFQKLHACTAFLSHLHFSLYECKESNSCSGGR